jgi:hypothetical protein
MRLRTGSRCDPLVLRVLRCRLLDQRPHQGLIRRYPVGDNLPLRAVPLQELHAPTPFMIAARQGERWHQGLHLQLPERRREGEVVESPLHLVTVQVVKT